MKDSRQKHWDTADEYAELKPLHAILFEMLTEVDRICKENGIRYYLDGGTLLGAVRHRGFIPWDDDLDIVITRSEYDRLKEACARDMDQARFFFQDHTTDLGYRWGYGRIRRKNTEFVRRGQEHLTMQTGVFLDIFVRDNIPNFYPVRLVHSGFCYLMRKILYSEVGKTNAPKRLQREVYRLLNHISPAAVFRRLERSRNRWNRRPTRYSRCYTFPYNSVRRFRKALGFQSRWFLEEPVEVEFNGGRFPGVRDYHGYLVCLYGDYMKIPPPDKRRGHAASLVRLLGDEIEEKQDQ